MGEFHQLFKKTCKISTELLFLDYLFLLLVDFIHYVENINQYLRMQNYWNMKSRYNSIDKDSRKQLKKKSQTSRFILDSRKKKRNKKNNFFIFCKIIDVFRNIKNNGGIKTDICFSKKIGFTFFLVFGKKQSKEL